MSRYRCRVGHAYGSAEDILEKNTDKLEDTLYFALNKLQENYGGVLRGAGVEATCPDTSTVSLGSPHPEKQTSAPSDLA